MTTSTPKLKLRLAGRSTFSPESGSPQFVDEYPKSKTRHSDGGLKAPTIPVDFTDEERPVKKRRVSSPGPAASSTGELGASAATPLYVSSGDTPRSKRDSDMSASTGQRPKGTVKDRGKGKQREFLKLVETSTPVTNARASSSKQLADYSAFKGRGRYTVNATEYARIFLSYTTRR